MNDQEHSVTVQVVLAAIVDLDDQIVVSVDPILYQNKWLFSTKKSDLTGNINYLWRPAADHPFNYNEHVTHTTTTYLHIDDTNTVPYGGHTYLSLQAPFSHEIIDS